MNLEVPKKVKLGTFMTSGHVMVSDPYFIGQNDYQHGEQSEDLRVLYGEWDVFVVRGQTPWGEVNLALIATFKGTAGQGSRERPWEEAFSLTIEHDCVGIYDMDEGDRPFYCNGAERLNKQDLPGLVFKYGAIAQSGLGNSVYSIFLTADPKSHLIDGIMVQFVDPEGYQND